MSFFCSKFSKATYILQSKSSIHEKASEVVFSLSPSYSHCRLLLTSPPSPLLWPLSSSRTDHLAVLHILHTHSYLPAFELAVPFAYNTFPPDTSTVNSLTSFKSSYSVTFKKLPWIFQANFNLPLPLLYNLASFLYVIGITFWHHLDYKCTFFYYLFPGRM